LVREFALDVEETQFAGEYWAFERGAYDITLTPKTGGRPIRDTGKYITIYSRANDGQCLIARDIWNSNNQPSPHS
jgi:ketosteroid isomerase-like protein